MTIETASADLRLHLPFAVSAQRLLTVLSTADGIKSWWTLFSNAYEKVGGRVGAHFPAAGFHAVTKTLRRKPPRLLEWECVESKHAEDAGHTDLHDWVGARIRFEVRKLGDAISQLDCCYFYLPQLACYSSRNSGSSLYLNESLHVHLERGNGKPWSDGIPHDHKHTGSEPVEVLRK